MPYRSPTFTLSLRDRLSALRKRLPYATLALGFLVGMAYVHSDGWAVAAGGFLAGTLAAVWVRDLARVERLADTLDPRAAVPIAAGVRMEPNTSDALVEELRASVQSAREAFEARPYQRALREHLTAAEDRLGEVLSAKGRRP